MQLKYIASNRVLAGPINTSIQGIKAKKKLQFSYNNFVFIWIFCGEFYVSST